MFRGLRTIINFRQPVFCQQSLYQMPAHRLNNFQQVRFITDADILKNLKQKPTTLVDRNSRYDANVKTLLPYIEKGDYVMAKQIVKKYNIQIDSHDWFENTPLTDAAMRGNQRAVKFLIEEMGANPHASCACPHHKTALHYAAECGHDEVVELLLKYGAQPNILDSRNYTALDVAKTKKIKKLLISRGGQPGSRVPRNTTQQLDLPKSNCPSLAGKK